MERFNVTFYHWSGRDELQCDEGGGGGGGKCSHFVQKTTLLKAFFQVGRNNDRADINFA